MGRLCLGQSEPAGAERPHHVLLAVDRFALDLDGPAQQTNGSGPGQGTTVVPVFDTAGEHVVQLEPVHEVVDDGKRAEAFVDQVEGSIFRLTSCHSGSIILVRIEQCQVKSVRQRKSFLARLPGESGTWILSAQVR